MPIHFSLRWEYIGVQFLFGYWIAVNCWQNWFIVAFGINFKYTQLIELIKIANDVIADCFNL